MKAYEAMGCSEIDTRTALTFCFINAYYFYLHHSDNEVKIFLGGAMRYLDLLTREARQ